MPRPCFACSRLGPRLSRINKERLYDIEAKYDAHVRRLGILNLPRRALLTVLYAGLYSTFHGPLGADAGSPRPAEGSAALGRISYISDLILMCPAEPTGTSGRDAWSVIDRARSNEVQLLLMYGHFSELVPEVRKGYWDVEMREPKHFVLSHPSERHAEVEMVDIMLSDLAEPYLRPPKSDLSDLLDEALSVSLRQDVPTSLKLVKELMDPLLEGVREIPSVSGDALKVAIGASTEEFLRFRAYWHAFAMFSLECANALKRRLVDDPSDDVINELIEWNSVCLSRNFVEGAGIALAEITPKAFDALMSIFLLGGPSGTARNYGDGFYPPLHYLGDKVIFSPDAVLRMMPMRNVLYSINSTDPGLFSRTLAPSMEPLLLDQIERLFRDDSALTLRRNSVWPHGEFDLLVYDELDNAALHIQAKAVIPPQGARMTYAVETRTVEALTQLERVSQLLPRERDELLSRTLGKKVRDVPVADVVVCRTCFGSFDAWETNPGARRANLSVLHKTVKGLRRDEGRIALGKIEDAIDRVIADLLHAVGAEWVQSEVDLGGLTLEVPLLKFSDEAIWQQRLSHFPDVTER